MWPTVYRFYFKDGDFVERASGYKTSRLNAYIVRTSKGLDFEILRIMANSGRGWVIVPDEKVEV